jgi:glycosyltransferase involved in cell wall biosynthesis
MPSVVHVVTTDKFAGVERYVCNTAEELARRGWDVAVVGGHPDHMPSALGSDIRWLPGATPLESFRSLMKLGRQDVCHAHMTIAETVAIVAKPLHSAAIVSTRHFAARRGSSPIGRALAPLISAKLDREIAVTEFVAESVERRPDAVIMNGIRPLPRLWRDSSRVVLTLQRLEREKDTFTALRAWRQSRMSDEGWSLRIVGDGTERRALESWVAANDVPSVVFVGWTSDVKSELARAGMMLAPAPSDSFGFGVLEGMSAGVPVVACAAGGHLETVGRLSDALLFSPADAEAAAAAVRSLLSDTRRAALSSAGRELVLNEFTVGEHVSRLLAEYETVLREQRKTLPKPRTEARGRRIGRSELSHKGTLRELVVCSLEAWDEVWRRNQFLVDILLRRNPALRVLFVEPPADPLFDLVERHALKSPRVRSITADGRLRAFRPLKALPRKAGPLADASLRGQILLVARLMHFSHPTIWINDVTYAPLIESTGWPSLYDVTDDWLLAPFAPRELERLRKLDEVALRTADQVVVCSPALAATRGVTRSVSLIPNGVDSTHFRRPRSRPGDLPQGLIAVYAGTLHDSRIDLELVVELARTLPHVYLVFVGPNSLGEDSRRRLDAFPNVLLLGARAYESVPGYLQHADVLIVPQRISPFTESLDPIKAYECLAVGTPTVATRAAGFRDRDAQLHVVDREDFVERVAEVFSAPPRISNGSEPPSWEERALDFERALCQASAGAFRD